MFIFGQRLNLINNLISGEVPTETLLASHAELAIHLATHLRRHTNRATIFIRDIDCLYKMIIVCMKEIFHRSILRAHIIDRSLSAHHIPLSQQSAMFQREVGHLVYALHPLPIKPLRYLLSSKARHPQVFRYLLQFAECHSQKRSFIHCYIIMHNRLQIYR